MRDCSSVMVLGRGWGFTRLTFPSTGERSRRRGATGESTPSAATATAAQAAMGCGQDPRSDTVQVMFSGKRGWETCALLCPSHEPGRADLVLLEQSRLSEASASQYDPCGFASKILSPG